MKIYGIYKGDPEAYYLQDLFVHKSAAIKRALELLEVEKAQTKQMQDYCKDDPIEGVEYKDWVRSSSEENRWDGDYEKSISVDEIEVNESND